MDYFGFKYNLGQKYYAPQVRLNMGSKFKPTTSRSWQHISCHWDACSNHLAISDFTHPILVLPLFLSPVQYAFFSSLGILKGRWGHSSLFVPNPTELSPCKHGCFLLLTRVWWVNQMCKWVNGTMLLYWHGVRDGASLKRMDVASKIQSMIGTLKLHVACEYFWKVVECTS